MIFTREKIHIKLSLLFFSLFFLCSCASQKSKPMFDLSEVARSSAREREARKRITETRLKAQKELDRIKALKELDRIKSASPKIPISIERKESLVDTISPVIEIISPKDDRSIEVIKNYALMVKGIAHDNSGIAWVTVNDINAALNEQGYFESEAYLKIGSNDIEIKAMDTRGNIGARTVSIWRTAPKEVVRSEKLTIPSKVSKPTLWVLSIGVSDYQRRGFNLNFADNDAINLAKLLGEQRGKLYSEVQVSTLLNEEVNRESILTAMGEFLGQAALNDIIFIFIAGHGIKHRSTGSYYFLPYDANSENLMLRGLRWSDFEETLKVLSQNVDKIILAIDTCHAGAMKIAIRGAEPGEDLAAIIKESSGFYIIAASKAGEESSESDDFKLESELDGHGAFTYSLLRGILGEANFDGNEYVSVSELFNFVAKEVPRITKGKQHPYARISGTDLPLVQIIKR